MNEPEYNHALININGAYLPNGSPLDECKNVSFFITPEREPHNERVGEGGNDMESRLLTTISPSLPDVAIVDLPCVPRPWRTLIDGVFTVGDKVTAVIR